MPFPPSLCESSSEELEKQLAYLSQQTAHLLGKEPTTSKYTSLAWRRAHQSELMAISKQLNKLQKASELSLQFSRHKIRCFLDELDERVERLLKDAKLYDNMYQNCYEQFVFLVRNFDQGQAFLSSKKQRMLKQQLISLFLMFRSVKAKRHFYEAAPIELLNALQKIDELEDGTVAAEMACDPYSLKAAKHAIQADLDTISELCDAFNEEKPPACYDKIFMTTLNDAFREVTDVVKLDELRARLLEKKEALLGEAKMLLEKLESASHLSCSSIYLNGQCYRVSLVQALELTKKLRSETLKLRHLLYSALRKGDIKALAIAVAEFKQQLLSLLEGSALTTASVRRETEILQRQKKTIKSSLIVLDYQLREFREQQLLLEAFSVLSEPIALRAAQLIEKVEALLGDRESIAEMLASSNVNLLGDQIFTLNQTLNELSVDARACLNKFASKLQPNSLTQRHQCQGQLDIALLKPLARQEAINNLYQNREYFAVLAVWCEMLDSAQFSAGFLPDSQVWVERVRAKFMALELKCLKPYNKNQFIQDTLRIVRSEFSEQMQQDISRRQNGGVLSFLRYRLILKIYIFFRALGLFRRRSYTLFANSQEGAVRDLLAKTSLDLINIQQSKPLQQSVFCNKQKSVFGDESNRVTVSP